MTLYLNGYHGALTPLVAIRTRPDWQGLDPEFAARVAALMIASGGALGFGGGSRTGAGQRALFLSRYHHDLFGPILFENQRWSLNRGSASAAPPGYSYHEPTTAAGRALAADMVGDLSWLHDHGAAYGLVEFSNVNSEPWHCQPIELPHSRAGYRSSMHPLAEWLLPRLQSDSLPTPPEEDDMNTARMIRPRGYLDVWLVGVGPALHLTPEMADSYAADKIPMIVIEAPYSQTLRALLAQSGLTEADLVPGGT